MTSILLLITAIIVICVLLNNASSKIGMPMLLAFIIFGMVFGNNGILPIKFDDYQFAEDICTVALIFIMFYGGFGTNWETAKGVVKEAGLLATIGVFLTAGITGLFCHFVLKWNWIEAMLMGSVVSSTDAASVFYILRSKKLGLKNGSAPLLEIESGSNDPCSYMLTIMMLSILDGKASAGAITWQLIAQLGFGALFGMIISQAAVHAMKKIRFSTSGFDSLFVLAIALFSYALPSAFGGNGYLSAYIVGIVLGNHQFPEKQELVHFFDGITGLMQVIIFFMLGLLAHPLQLSKCFLPALAIFGVMLLVSRPVSVCALLAPFRKYKFKQLMLISFAGLRGAASIVFAIMATIGNTMLENDIFSIVFCIVLISIAIQGSFIPFAAKKLDMIDKDADVMTTFNDFKEDTDIQFSEIIVDADSHWKDRTIKDIGIPKNMLICMVLHDDGSSIVPKGDTVLREKDVVVLCSKAYKSDKALRIVEHPLSKNSKWIGKMVRDYPDQTYQLVMIKRGKDIVIPRGHTVLEAGDILYINESDKIW